MKFDVRCLYVIVLGSAECHENQCVEHCMFLWLWMKLCLCMYHKTIWHSEIKEYLGNVCLLCHGVYCLQSWIHYPVWVTYNHPFFLEGGACIVIFCVRLRCIYFCISFQVLPWRSLYNIVWCSPTIHYSHKSLGNTGWSVQYIAAWNAWRTRSEQS